MQPLPSSDSSPYMESWRGQEVGEQGGTSPPAAGFCSGRPSQGCQLEKLSSPSTSLSWSTLPGARREPLGVFALCEPKDLCTGAELVRGVVRQLRVPQGARLDPGSGSTGLAPTWGPVRKVQPYFCNRMTVGAKRP